MNYFKAKECLLKIDLKNCEPFFEEHNFYLETAYCKMLKGDLKNAKKFFEKIRENDLRADWGLHFLQLMKNYIQILPTYLQIRNFLEIDINLLIKAGKPEYVENVINCADLLFEVNQESYKFIARVLMNNNYPTVAKIFLNKGVEKCYNDPELHFIYGNYHLLYNNKLLAKNQFETSLEVLPGYYPAIMMLKEFE